MARKPKVLLKQSAYRLAVKPRSSILIVALWSLCLLSAFAVILSYNVRQKISLVKRLEERAKLSLLAEAGVRQAMALLKESVKDYDSLSDPWSSRVDMLKDVAVGDGVYNIKYESIQSGIAQVRYGLIDEERKININKAPMIVLERLFCLASSCDENQARELAASVIDWRDSDSELSVPTGGAEDFYYKTLDHPYEASDADFSLLEEVLLVKGMDEGVFSQVRDYITIYGSGLVNVNTADKAVLMALGLDEYTADSIILFRMGNDGVAGTIDDNAFESTYDIALKTREFCSLSSAQLEQLDAVAGQNLTTKSNNFMIKCIANLNKRTHFTKVECVVNRSEKILYWNQT